MRRNEPVTQHEVIVPDGEPLVSRTDTGGRITFVNRTFVNVSGFTEDELLGAPHNTVRHPAMPQAAFASLWATIKAGRPWDGLVKNRTKSGDFYWVRANVTPVIENGEVTGFISIRSKPARAQIAAAEIAYAAIANGTARNLFLRDGALVKSGWRPIVADLAHSVAGRLAAAALATLLVIVAIGWLGFSGMAASNHVLRNVYQHDLVAVNQLRDMVDRIRDNRNHLAQLAVALGHGVRPEAAINQQEPAVRANLAQIAESWRAYQNNDLSPEQRDLAQTFASQYAELLHEAFEPALAMGRRGDTAQLETLFGQKAPVLFTAVFGTARKLVDLQIASGRHAYDQATASLWQRLTISTIGGGVGLLVILLLGWALLRTVRLCVRAFEGHFQSIVRGDFESEIVAPAAREFRHMASMLRAMRANLMFKRWKARNSNARRRRSGVTG